MQFTAKKIAELINGTIEGDPDVAVSSFGKLEEATEGQLAFFSNPKYEEYLYSTKASIIIVNTSLELEKKLNATLIRVPDAYSSFAVILTAYSELAKANLTGIQEPSYISPSVKMGENVFVGAFTYIGKDVKIGNNVKVYPQVFLGDKVSIGDNSILYPGVKIHHDCEIGKNVSIHAGCVIGGDGFGYAPQKDGSFVKVPQIGNVLIEDNVEIGMNTVIAAQSGVSGSTKIGNNVMIGGQAGIVGHIQIADGSKINAQSGVGKSIKKPNTAVTGSPAYDYSHALRSQIITRNLPELEKRIKNLEETIEMMKKENITE